MPWKRGTPGKSENLVVTPLRLLQVAQVVSIAQVTQCQEKLNCESGNKSVMVSAIRK